MIQFVLLFTFVCGKKLIIKFILHNFLCVWMNWISASQFQFYYCTCWVYNKGIEEQNTSFPSIASLCVEFLRYCLKDLVLYILPLSTQCHAQQGLFCQGSLEMFQIFCKVLTWNSLPAGRYCSCTSSSPGTLLVSSISALSSGFSTHPLRRFTCDNLLERGWPRVDT